MFSIYTTLYRLDNGFIDWREALKNFSNFADEVCVSTLNGVDADILENYAKDNPKIKIVNCSYNLKSIDFDGKLKNAALSLCTQPYCILLDGDERISPNSKNVWRYWAKELEKTKYDAFLIPVIDLFNSEKEYKSIGLKWYLHRNDERLRRGIVNFAKRGDKIDINASDTCELIHDDGDLCHSISIASPTIRGIKEIGINIWHLGWLDKEKRLKSNDFWQPVWDNRAGKEVTNIIHTKEKLDKIEYFEHGLKLWYE